MNDSVLKLIQSGKIPYRYEVDPKSGLYFGLAVLAVILVFALAQQIAIRLIN